MEFKHLAELATVLRHSGDVVLKHNAQLTITNQILSEFNSSFESASTFSDQPMTSSFHIATNTPKDSLLDLHLVARYFKQTTTLKLIGINSNLTCDLTHFNNLRFLELSRIDVNSLIGFQKLKSKLQKLVCFQCTGNIDDGVLRCSGLQMQCWNELKEASFVGNCLTELNESIEFIPWIHTLDLSHNELIDPFDNLNSLLNLKYLNLAYNKIRRITPFKGSVCNRMQTLILRNNFIEDISGLQTLTNLNTLDLSNNSLDDHNCLHAISNLITLQCLNLINNPLSFHPQHRILTLSYLNPNTHIHCTVDHLLIQKNERMISKNPRPIQTRPPSSMSSSITLNSAEKSHRVRMVEIQDDSTTKRTKQSTEISTPPSTFTQPHIDTKKRIEELREEYGDNWLNQQSGCLVQNVLGLDSSLRLQNEEIVWDQQNDEKINGVDETLIDTNSVYDNNINTEQVEDDMGGESDLEEGEESIYLATAEKDGDEIFLIIGSIHLSEKSVATGEERERWHINSVISCELIEAEMDERVKICFDTMRKDRKERVYRFVDDELVRFMDHMKKKLSRRVINEKKQIEYQCMKCQLHFSRPNNVTVLETNSISCPKCESTLIVEVS